MPRPTIRLGRAKHCPLCKGDIAVDYKEVVLLRKYLSERGKILGRAKTGICARHQRQVTKGIKRARYMALLPFSQT
ncbi:30S ribosomal protein S18 [Candidatus Curtissbacteria bacterium RIFCSPHIGHO2_01_FULL_41_11]|uniref:Small ribosomal subunit protein bS18 n=1 Tax=Candidatus Curtissbacteria bacterium RIFCSPHIGHO2_01_FULL_41_11 TaxID=1797711 RepID=A0A1F5G5P6_9BACT|nr:MAG: 30S ribosomal protein S18 [Candidatus Curtissbacteria bacterium RIFCSPHIGHO2_01_FULL_41_11]